MIDSKFDSKVDSKIDSKVDSKFDSKKKPLINQNLPVIVGLNQKIK